MYAGADDRDHPLRVAHITWLAEIGGGELFALGLLRHADHQRFAQAVISLGPEGEPLRQARALGAPVRHLARRGRLGVGLLARVVRALRQARPDVVQTHGEGGAIWGIAAARLAGCRAVASLVYQNHRSAWHKMHAMRMLLPLSAAVVGGSLDVCRFLSRELGVSPDVILHIPCGIDPEPFAAAAAARPAAAKLRERPVVVTVGRLVPEKGHAVLLHALRRVRSRCAAELVIVGDGPLREPLVALAAELGLSGCVRFAGTVYPATAVLSEADVFAFPSLLEPQGLALLEAFAAGVPVVASRTGGIPEMLADGRDGLLVPPGDADALAAALIDLLQDPARRAAFAADARRRVDEFDIHSIARRCEELWTALAARSARSG